ncbi:hypothetical protein QPK87_06695 [Kamptonema cortianum]|nr:hypothetical protein [Geitlerinema splendidum]MDK3156261.1 hypothetical protein [Kamptonema cortianum]
MTFSAFALAVALGFPEEPVEGSFLEGQALATRQHGIEPFHSLRVSSPTAERARIPSIYQRDQKVIGTWFDRTKKIETEWVLSLTPNLVSRWLGYLDIREGWTQDEAQTRWKSIRNEIAGREVFLVTLSAFPSQSPFGVFEERANSPEETVQVRFLIESAEGRQELQAFLLHSRRAKSRQELDSVAWWDYSPFAKQLSFSMAGRDEPPLIQRGDYYRTWWWVWTDEPLPESYELKVLSVRKIRTARFGTLASKTGV